MSHDIRTPMNAIIGYADLARIENDRTEIEYSVSDVEKDFRNCIAMFQNQADSKGQTLTVTAHLLHPYGRPPKSGYSHHRHDCKCLFRR